jgi:hypothetical protein
LRFASDSVYRAGDRDRKRAIEKFEGARDESAAKAAVETGRGRVKERGGLRVEKDIFAGGLMLLLGLGAVIESRTYGIGALMQMGPGFMPTLLGVILIVLGVWTCASVFRSGGREKARLAEWRDWLSWLLIAMGPIAFIILGPHGGFIPATFACVFISARADRSATWKSAFLLASIATLAGVLLFGFILRVPFPMFQWG